MGHLDTYSISDRLAFVRAAVERIGAATEGTTRDALHLVIAELEHLEKLSDAMEMRVQRAAKGGR